MRLAARAVVLLAALALVTLPASGQGFAGTYTAPLATGGSLTLALREDPGGIVTGSMSGDGTSYLVEGRVEGDAVVGIMRAAQTRLHFEAGLWEQGVWVTLYASDELGQPRYDDYEQYDFYASGSGGPRPPRPGRSGGGVRPGVGNPLARGGGTGAPPGGNPLGRGDDPFVGTFTDGNVTLWLQGVAGQYEGQVTIGGETFSVTASGSRSALQGVVHAQDGAYALTVQAVDGVLYLESGGELYYLYPRDAYGYGPGGVAGGVRPGQPGGVWPPVGAPAVPPGGDPTFTDRAPLADRWNRFLRGNKLTRLQLPSGAPPGLTVGRADVSLCSVGSFTLRGDGASARVDPSGRPLEPDVARGTWYVLSDGRAARLVLEPVGGGSVALTMEFRGDATFADGARVYVAPATGCR